MNPTEVNQFNELYKRHPRLVKFQGKSQKTVDFMLFFIDCLRYLLTLIIE